MFNKNFEGRERSAGTAMGSYGVDTNWYSYFGTTDHITDR
jgi:hypothetical protein